MKAKKYVSIGVLVVVILAILFYLSTQPQLLAALWQISWKSLAVIVVFRLLFLITSGLYLQAFTKKFNINLTFTEWFGLSVVTTMGNYITPFAGGMVARAAYLKHKHNFAYASFATLLASNYLVIFWVIGAVGFATLTVFYPFQDIYIILALIFLALPVAISMLTMLPNVSLPDTHRLFRILNTSLEGWDLVKNDKKLIAKLGLYTVANITLNGLSFWVAYNALGFTVSFSSALLISLIAVFSILLNITPGNLGVQEIVVSVSSTLLGPGGGEGLVVALIIRAATLFLVFTLGPIYAWLLSRLVTETKH